MKNKSVLFLSQAAIIAAMYVVLTMLANLMGLANYAVQVRFSEALNVLAVFTPAAIPGLFVGCLISNMLSGCVVWDVLFGSIATLIGAVGTYMLRNFKFLSLIPPILSNTLIIPFVLVYAYGMEGTVPLFMLTVGLGELISCGILGYILMNFLKKNMRSIKWS